MDNHTLENWDIVFIHFARAWVEKKPAPGTGLVLFMVAAIDGCMPIDIEHWPFFWHDPNTAWEYFKAHYPTTRHLVVLDLSHGHPRACWKRA